MKVKVTTKVLLHDTLGRLVAGDVVELSDGQARDFIASGWAEAEATYETKVVRETPAELTKRRVAR
jgi:hypothetical protein